MRVVNAARPHPATEAQVLAALRAWDVPGIAISGALVPVTGTASAEADVVVILPHLAVVCEVKGIRERVGGVLSCPVQGDWSMPGIVGDPVHAQAGGNPLEQLTRTMFGFKNFAESVTGASLFTNGLVLVVPWEGTTLTLDKGPIPMPTGRDVLVADRDGARLRAWCTRRVGRREVVWTADRVAAVLAGLGFTDTARTADQRVTHAELVAAGFPGDPAQAATEPAATMSPCVARCWTCPPTTPVTGSRDTSNATEPPTPAASTAR
ncbi:nuclease-related domain-containing protein [Nocardia sp. CC201C]|uniref:nuclease-related domain-containing protein n=1 Tax=Nocardia sp. CC201C TaxID=3044575 RepID=UPI0024A87BF3|nr:nuclease-related domain-containing protein [Nocardia sp. CC201C]